MEIFARFSKWIALLILLTLGGLFLRLFKLSFSFPYSGEIGDNLLQIKNYYLSGQIPLLGPPTSHPWLSFGPLFYWIYGPILVLSKFNPLSYAYFGAVVSTLAIPLNFIVVKKLFGSRVAIISTILIATSPVYLTFSLNARFFNIVSVLIYPFILFLYKALFENKKYFIYLALTLGVMLNFHYTPIFLIAVVIILTLYLKIRLSVRQILLASVAFIIPLSPLLIYDSRNNFKMITSLILWLPYRLLGFSRLYPKNNLSIESLSNSANSLFEYVSSSFSSKGSLIGLLAAIFICLFLIRYLFEVMKTKKISNSMLIILTMFFTGIVALTIHQEPPIHYFLPIFPIPIMLFSVFIDELYSKKSLRIISVLIISTCVIVNIFNTISSRLKLEKQTFASSHPYFIPYTLQKDIASYIVNDSKGEPYILRRIGPYDEFEGDFAQNYQYLTWLYGNEPAVVGTKVISENKAEIKYTIIEDISKVQYIQNPYIDGGIIVSKTQLK